MVLFSESDSNLKHTARLETSVSNCTMFPRLETRPVPEGYARGRLVVLDGKTLQILIV